MKHLEVIIMLPIAILGLLLLMVIDLVRAAKGKQTVDEEWHDIYMDSDMNHGQGRKDDEEGSLETRYCYG